MDDRAFEASSQVTGWFSHQLAARRDRQNKTDTSLTLTFGSMSQWRYFILRLAEELSQHIFLSSSLQMVDFEQFWMKTNNTNNMAWRNDGFD